MKNKIYYNFLNEHVLIEGYLNNCNNNTILREAIIKYSCNSTQTRTYPLKKNENDLFYLRDYFQASNTPLIIIFILMSLFTFYCITYMIMRHMKIQHKETCLQMFHYLNKSN